MAGERPHGPVDGDDEAISRRTDFEPVRRARAAGGLVVSYPERRAGSPATVEDQPAGTRLSGLAVAGLVVWLVGSMTLALGIAFTRDDASSSLVRGFALVGHSSLLDRGMNSALALYGDWAYVGSRTDRTAGHAQARVLVVDLAEPSVPTPVAAIGKPFGFGPLRGRSTRELRVWPQQKLLIVMTVPCTPELHDCRANAGSEPPTSLLFYDLTIPSSPRYLSSYVLRSEAGHPVEGHEFFLWVDPEDPERALLWVSTPTESRLVEDPNVLIVDVSKVTAGGRPRLVATGNWNDLFGASDAPPFVHSMAPSVDGRTTYLAYFAGSVLALDTSDVARGNQGRGIVQLHDRLLTQPESRPRWPRVAAHSAVPIPGRPLVVSTDEVYGTYADSSGGCPWGWVHILDFGRSGRATVVGEFKVAENDVRACAGPALDQGSNRFASFAAHNPTVLRDLAFVTWHSAGLRAVDLSDPSSPQPAGHFTPTPLPVVVTEDPALSRGKDKVVMWSYPIVKGGLVYVVDIRNGLYVLRYTGPGADVVSKIEFLEGNSNLGDAVRLAEG